MRIFFSSFSFFLFSFLFLFFFHFYTEDGSDRDRGRLAPSRSFSFLYNARITRRESTWNEVVHDLQSTYTAKPH